MSQFPFLSAYKEIISIVIPATISFFVGKSMSARKTNYFVAEKRFYYVYLPIFKLIEPHLYKQISREQGIEIINTVNKLILDHYELFEPPCIHAYQTFRNGFLSVTTYDHRSYEDFCRYIDREYERLKRKLHLPKRTLLYKLATGEIVRKPRIIVDEMVEKITMAFIITSAFLGLIMLTRFLLTITEKISFP